MNPALVLADEPKLTSFRPAFSSCDDQPRAGYRLPAGTTNLAWWPQ
jgi:hypothetical protein